MVIDTFFEDSTVKNPESLMDHFQRTPPGEAAFLPTTLSLLYSKLARKFIGPGLEKPTDTRDQNVGGPNPIVEPVDPLACHLICPLCSNHATLEDLSAGLRCPRCRHGNGTWRELPFMQCPICKTARTMFLNSCLNTACPARFV